MKTAILLAAGVSLLAFAGFGGSSHCNGNVTDLGGVFYVDDRDLTTGGLWLYVESNGTPGLQSGGTGPLEAIFAPTAGLPTGQIASSVDTCTHENPDTLIF